MKKERGQVLVIGLFFSIGLALAVFTVANIGIMAAERVKLQNTVDASAYSAATAEARYMNLAAYINRSMVANYNSIAFNMALYSTVDAYDHGGAMTSGMLYVLANLIPVIGEGVAQVGKGIDNGFHHPMHTFNRELIEMFDPGHSKNLNKYLELYNTNILSIYQGILYVAAQGIRASVADTIARRSDPNVDIKTSLGLVVESENYRNLQDSVDYAQSSSHRPSLALKKLSGMFDSMMSQNASEEAPLLLGAVSEASLDRFAAGRKRDGAEDTIRNFNTSNIMTGNALVRTLIKAYLATMQAACLVKFAAWCAKHCWKHHRWPCTAHIDATLGAEQRWGSERRIFEERSPVFNSSGVREVSGFGGHMNFQVREAHTDWVSINVPGLGGGGSTAHSGANNGVFDFNYSSGTAKNDAESLNNIHAGGERAGQCVSPWARHSGNIDRLIAAGICNQPIDSTPCNQGKVNACLSETFFQFLTLRDKSTDSHWDGTFSETATAGTDPVYDPGTFIRDQMTYRANGGFPLGSKLHRGVPSYKYENPLSHTGVTNYVLPKSGADRRSAHNTRGQASFEGPSLMVIGSKPAQRVAMLRIAGMTNPYSLVAIARGQAYYKHNPRRPKEIASAFNPYWGARLAPIDSDNLRRFQRASIPFVASQGIPITPNH